MFEGLLQPTHLLVILVIGLIVFGPGKLGELGGQLGRGVSEFKRQLSEGQPDGVSTAARFCAECGAPHDGSARFCPQCAKAIR